MCFTAQSEAEVVRDVLEVNGVCYGYRGSRRRSYVSLFGEVQVARAYYWSADGGGVCPLDGALSLPARCYSDSVQARLGAVNVGVPQDHSLELLERWLGLKIPKGSLQSSASAISSKYERICLRKIADQCTGQTACRLRLPWTPTAGRDHRPAAGTRTGRPQTRRDIGGRNRPRTRATRSVLPRTGVKGCHADQIG